MPSSMPNSGLEVTGQGQPVVDTVAGGELTQPRLPAVTAGMCGWGSLKAPSLHQGQAQARRHEAGSDVVSSGSRSGRSGFSLKAQGPGPRADVPR